MLSLRPQISSCRTQSVAVHDRDLAWCRKPHAFDIRPREAGRRTLRVRKTPRGFDLRVCVRQITPAKYRSFAHVLLRLKEGPPMSAGRCAIHFMSSFAVFALLYSAPSQQPSGEGGCKISPRHPSRWRLPTVRAESDRCNVCRFCVSLKKYSVCHTRTSSAPVT